MIIPSLAVPVIGKVEVYAVRRKKTSFRRIFLMELALWETVFPPMDEFEQIDIFVHAVEDAELWKLMFFPRRRLSFCVRG